MRTSSDFFDQPYVEEEPADLATRPTVPFIPVELAAKPVPPPIPKVHYPIYNRFAETPLPQRGNERKNWFQDSAQSSEAVESLKSQKTAAPYAAEAYNPPSPKPQASALEQIQMEIEKEVKELHQTKPSLDQLIQTALSQKIQHEQTTQKPKIVTMRKITPAPAKTAILPPVGVPQKIRMTPTPIPPSLAEPALVVSKTKPFQQPTQGLWWPSKQEIITEQLKKMKQVETPPPVPIKIAPPVKPSPLTASLRSAPVNTPNLTAPKIVAKNAYHVSNNILSYLLFSIDEDSDPYNDANRQKVIYLIKIGAYLTMLVGTYEFMRYFNAGLSVNSILEVAGIFLISAILFFFGQNLSILFKPSNPYQIHEIV